MCVSVGVMMIAMTDDRDTSGCGFSHLPRRLKKNWFRRCRVQSETLGKYNSSDIDTVMVFPSCCVLSALSNSLTIA